MIIDRLGDPPRSTQQEILEVEQVRANHIVDVLHRCHRIMEIGQVDIDK